MIIKNGFVFTKECKFEELSVVTDGDRITDINIESNGVNVFDASDSLVLPGLTDIHFHGCDGHDFCDGSFEAIDAIAAFEIKQGVTSICPATMTISADRLDNICKCAAEYDKKQKAGKIDSCRSELVGIHMEGPFINVNKKGAQNAEFIQTADAGKIRRWVDYSNGLVKIMSIAPDTENAIEIIKECSDIVRFSIGHTESDYDTAIKAFEAGADHCTHLYNAMPPFTHRAPGVIGAAADTPKAYAELICDGIHIDPAVIRSTFKLFGDDRMVLISDSMEATGKPDGVYSLGGQEVHVKGNLATLADGTLAGSATPLYQCMKNAVSFGIPLESAIKAATINPCKAIGIDGNYGTIEIGKKAHFLILNKADLSIKAVILGDDVFTF